MFAEFSADAAFILSADGLVEHANEGAKKLLGLSSADLRGQSIFSLSHDECVEPLREALAQAHEGLPQTLILQLRSSAGEDVHLHAKMFLDLATKHLWMVGSDLSSFNQKEAELRQRALHDSMTGLPNRALLNDRMEWLLSEARRQNKMFAVVAMDLDGFKKANDAFGHLAGDELLKEVARRIKGCVREEDTVGRTGGDEFVLILPELNTPAEAQQVCERIMDAIRRPILIQGHDIYVSSSVGIAVFPEHGASASELMQHADQAMYLSKHHGKNRLSFYAPELSPSKSHISLEASMHAAINDGEFAVYYQPIVDFNGKLKGCEALMRWRRADGTFVPPSEFIPVAESNGLITLLGDYVLRVAVAQLRLFDAAGLKDLYVSVNVSPRQLRHPNFETNLKKVLQVSGIDPKRLVLEITESILMNGQERTQALLRKVAATGIRFSLDDFGTGYSCLAYLKTYPISKLKVDKSFVIGIEEDAVSRAIVKAIVNLSQALGLNTVVEGVETQAQMDALVGMDIDLLQGYLFGKPIPPSEFITTFTQADADKAGQ